jgi:hypothetical protein
MKKAEIKAIGEYLKDLEECLDSETTEGLIEGFDSCLRQILTDLEKDLRESPP